MSFTVTGGNDLILERVMDYGRLGFFNFVDYLSRNGRRREIDCCKANWFLL